MNIHWINPTAESTLQEIRTPYTTSDECIDKCHNQGGFTCSTVCITGTECVETDILLDPRFDESLVPNDGRNNFLTNKMIDCYTNLTPNNLAFGLTSSNSSVIGTNRGFPYLAMGIHSREKSRMCLRLYSSSNEEQPKYGNLGLLPLY